MRLWAALVLMVAGCGGGEACRCQGEVPGGTIDIACGQTDCLGSHGYRCTGPNQAVPADSVCSVGTTTGSTTGGSTTGNACAPDCQDYQCGSDGCGGSCGTCDSTSTCKSGFCVQNCQPDCSGKSCGDDGCGGSCGTCSTGQYCNEFNSTDNGYKGQCQATNWCAGSDKYAEACDAGCCPDAPYHEYSSTSDDFGTYYFCQCRTTCIPADELTNCLHDSDCCSDSTCSLTPGYYGGICTGGCSRKACTASLSNGGECCPSNPYCAGVNGCSNYRGYAGSTCADDAACESGFTCVAGKCTAPCTPSCVGRTCGDNGCGGSCGTCSSGTCTTAGSCCQPVCGGKSCGDDTCGGSCGTCSTGVCLSGSCCMPMCSGKQCGDDTCGGSCGTCGLGQLCSGSSCVTDPNYCDPVANTGCTMPNQCILLASEKTSCVLVGSGTQGSFCSAGTPCSGGYSCFAGSCRKVCDLSSSGECGVGSTCNGVSGWVTHGACT